MQYATVVRSSFLIAILCAASACSGGGGGGSSPADVSGSLSFVPEVVPLVVQEPNDSIDAPQGLEPLRAGARYELADAVDADEDPLDGFRLVAREALHVRATWKRLAGWGDTPELLVHDPVGMRPVQIARDGVVEFGLLGVCDLVVRARGGAAEYLLSIEATEGQGGPLRIAQLGAGDALDGGVERFTALEALEFDASELSGSELYRAADDSRIEPDAAGRLSVAALESVRVVAGASGLRAVARRWSASREGARRSSASVPLALELAPANARWGRARLRSMPGELLVKPRAGEDLTDTFGARGLVVVDSIPGDVVRVQVEGAPPGDSEELARLEVALAAGFLADERIDYAERNLMRHALGGPLTPNDTHFGLQWHYPLLRLPEAWSITTGDDAVLVAVLDTGETAHPDLAGRQVAGFDFISNPANAGDGDGRDADPTDVGDGNGLQPSSFHGTHVAGTIAAATNNSSGVAGVTWSGKVMHLRVLGLEGGTDFDIANAIRYSARLTNASGTLPAQRANVINLSLGGPGSSSTVQSAVTAARGQGCVVFAAAGNENTSTPSFPAAYAGVISVAAVDANASRAPYSNFGATIDLAAPGGNTAADLDADGYADGVLSTAMSDSGGPATPVFAFYQGTSMACPHAAGVAALMLAVDPTLTPDEIEVLLKDTATDLGAAGRDDLFGEGLIDALAAVSAAAGLPPPGTPAIELSPLSIAFGTGATMLGVQVANGGGGTLDVSTLTITTTDGNPWLSAVPVAVPVPVTTDTSAVQVFVDRSGLADGNYTGSVQVGSNGGTRTVSVTMTVDSSAPIDVDLFVLAVDADTFESVAEFVANPSTTLAYIFESLPPGDYILAAGSDDDLDDFICGEGDTYCGLYPSINEPEVITVNGTALTALDFPVTSGSAPAAVANPSTRPNPIRRPSRR